MTAVEGPSTARGEESGMAAKAASERFEVVRSDSSLTFYATSTNQSAYGKTTDLSGFIEASFDAQGILASEPAPKMHVECQVESLRTGNDLQDREMWKLIDSKRFPKIAGDLREFQRGSVRGRYTAAGLITLAGLARTYESEFTLDHGPAKITVNGEIKIDVRDFGLKPMKLLVLGVAPLVRVRLHLVAASAV
jgi:polyisoprenoid-binding protein YceI